MLRIPANGSPLANLLLIVLGIFVGGAAAWMLHPNRNATSDAARSIARTAKRLDPATDNEIVDENSGINESDSRASLGPRRLSDLLALVDPRDRARALHDHGAATARQDLELALRQGLDIPRRQDQLDYFRGVFGVWAELDPESALTYAQRTFTPGVLQSDMLGLSIHKWAAHHPREAWLWTEQHLSGPQHDQALTDLMVGWTRRQPASAARWLASTGLTSQALYTATAKTWAEQDPNEAFAWTGSLPATRARSVARSVVAVEWARQDPAAAAAAVTPALAVEPNAPELATVLADVWGTIDPAATATWIASLPPGPVREQAAGTLATVWAPYDIDGALAWSEQLQDPAMRRQVIAHLGTTLGALQPDRALAWLATLPAEDAADGLAGAFNSWAATDAMGLYDWIGSVNDPQLADHARRSLGDVVTQEDMFGAMEIALSIESASLRDETLTRYFRRWQRQDPASADEWLSLYGPTLAPDTRTVLVASQRAVAPAD